MFPASVSLFFDYISLKKQVNFFQPLQNLILFLGLGLHPVVLSRVSHMSSLCSLASIQLYAAHSVVCSALSISKQLVRTSGKHMS
jgi:hypothetical protein